MKHYLHKKNLIPWLTVVLIGGITAFMVLYVYKKHHWVQNRLDEVIEPRYARLAGLKASENDLEAAAARAHQLEAQYIYSIEQDTNQAGNDAQQRIRSLLSAAGMTISSSQVLPAKDAAGLERIPVSVRAEGDLSALHSALAGIAEHRPVVLIDGINVQAAGAPERGVQRLSVQFNFLVLRRSQS